MKMKVSKIVALIVVIAIVLSATSYVLFAGGGGGLPIPVPTDPTTGDDIPVNPAINPEQIKLTPEQERMQAEIQVIDDKIKAIVDDSLKVTPNRLELLNENDLVNKLENEVDFDKLQANSEALGAKYEEPLTAKFIVKTAKTGITNINLKATDGLTINTDGSISENIEGSNAVDTLGKNARKAYWWGSRDWMKVDKASDYQDNVYKMATGWGFAAVPIGIANIFAGIGAAGMGCLTAWHAIDVGRAIRKCNNRGIIVDCTWWLTWSCYSQ
jgi:hypothetical protein